LRNKKEMGRWGDGGMGGWGDGGMGGWGDKGMGGQGDGETSYDMNTFYLLLLTFKPIPNI